MTDWEQIVRGYGPFVFRLARRITGRDDDADDVVQEVFMEVYRFHQREVIREWQGMFRRKTTQRALDRLRRRRPVASIDAIDIPSRSDCPVQAAMMRELASRLRCAIAELPQQQANVFCLRYFDGQSNAEIAQSLEMTPGAVATALHKARQRLTLVLSNHLDGESQ